MSITFTKSLDTKPGAEKLATTLRDQIIAGKRVLWLVPGGSNINVAASVLIRLKEMVTLESLKNITVTLTDERYGAIGHADSNWKQLIDAGFDFELVDTIPVLTGSIEVQHTLDETVTDWKQHMNQAINEHDVLIGMFGMGTDGHIAGVLPHTPAVECTEFVCGYVSEKFVRITLTPAILKKCNQAFLFAFGESKKQQLENLKDKQIGLSDQPVQILKEIQFAYVYSDCL